MKFAVHMIAAALMLASVSACQTTGTGAGPGPVIGVGNAAADDALKATKVVLTGYVDIYQPAVIAYGSLPDCPGATLCRDRVVLDKLKAADAAAMAVLQTAMNVIDGKTQDSGGDVQRALSAIQAAEVQIAASGAMSLTQK